MEYEYSDEKGRRVKTPKLPPLKSRELMLAFLLGFYDGDDSLEIVSKSRIRPRIASSNKDFMQSIKDYFGINYKISPFTLVKYSYSKEKKIKIECNRLELGESLFKEMLEIYPYSLLRKRVPLVFFKNIN